jgi:hypothetical protein
VENYSQNLWKTREKSCQRPAPLRPVKTIRDANDANDGAGGAFRGHCAHEGPIHSATLRTGCIVPPQGEKDGEINLAATDGERREGAVVLPP